MKILVVSSSEIWFLVNEVADAEYAEQGAVPLDIVKAKSK